MAGGTADAGVDAHRGRPCLAEAPAGKWVFQHGAGRPAVAGEIPPQDQAFASRLFFGVLERQMTLDYVLGSCSSQPLRRCHPVVLDTLRAGSYQLLFMDKIPPSAAVNEAVRCAKALKQGHASGFVNGVLRQVSRRGRELLEGLPEGEEGG